MIWDAVITDAHGNPIGPDDDYVGNRHLHREATSTESTVNAKTLMEQYSKENFDTLENEIELEYYACPDCAKKWETKSEQHECMRNHAYDAAEHFARLATEGMEILEVKG